MDINDFWKIRQNILSTRRVLDLSLINPDLQVPKKVLDLASKTLNETGINRYPTAKGNKKALAKILEYWNTLSGINYSEDEICLSSGTKDSLASFFRVKALPGQVVWTQEPTYPMYNLISKSFGLKLKQTSPDFIVLTAPNNPSGRFLELQQIEAYIRDNQNIWIFFDAVYAPFFPKTLELLKHLRGLTQNLIVSFSFSKAFSMAGVRMGSLFGPRDAIDQIVKAKSRLDYGVDLFSSICAWAMLELADDFANYAYEVYSRRYEIAKKLLGHYIVSEPGLPFLWLDFGGLDSNKIFDELVLKRILVLPGAIFGDRYQACLRISLTAPDTELLVAFKSLVGILETNFSAQAINF